MAAQRHVTMNDVAKRAGVSLKTVSNVVNGYRFVKDSTRRKVLTAIDELGYSVNVVAKSLREGRSNVIGISLPNMRLPYFAELYSCLAEEARTAGRRVIFADAGTNRADEIELLHGSFASLIDGLLLSPCHLTNNDADMLDVDYPIVLIGEQMRLDTRDRVTTENERGIYLATTSLIKKGCRRVAIVGVGGRGTASEPLRLNGYRRALNDAGITVDISMEIPADIWNQPAGASAAGTLFRNGLQVDGIVCMNDLLAMGVMQELRRRGVLVPDDVKVVGYDDSIDAQYFAPSLSSVNPRLRSVARTAIALLCARIDGTDPLRSVDPSEHAVTVDTSGFITAMVPCELVERDSSR
ncbi:LacI family DNA-binding transcriptional regulator [Bifidobacterium simiiventris]|uniref:LacI family DNA-binding transcriptional regulator n=1 Tax=Bifidobacterium simiiventris TaxID=2834434 RepID=UPI001C579834|nr:LacI family DNA-binding transcriptional regulator [Bifidobacterium simiiventris]